MLCRLGHIPHEQGTQIQGKRECVDALLIDTMTMGKVKDKRKTMFIAWIGHQKAFDHMPINGW